MTGIVAVTRGVDSTVAIVLSGESERQREVVEDCERAPTIDDQVVALLAFGGLS